MKKHLIAAAVVATFAIPAAAQVSVYGSIGHSFDQAEISGVKISSTSSRDPLNASRIGFKGAEDLGGGMKLSFTLEGNLHPQDGSGGATGGGLMFDRAAFINLETGQFAVQTGRFANATKRLDGAASAGTSLLDLGTFLFSTDTAGSFGITTKIGVVNVWAATSSDVAAAAAAPTTNAQAGLSETGAGAGLTVGGISLNLAQTARGAGTETVTTVSGSVVGVQLTALISKSDTGVVNTKTGNTQIGVIYPVAGLVVRGSVGKFSSDTTTSRYKYMGVLVEKPLSKRSSVYVGYSDKDVNNGLTGDTQISTVGITHSF